MKHHLLLTVTNKKRFSKFVSGKLKEIGNTILPPSVDELSLRETQIGNSNSQTENSSEFLEKQKTHIGDINVVQNRMRKSVVKYNGADKGVQPVSEQSNKEEIHDISTSVAEVNTQTLSFKDFFTDGKEFQLKHGDPKEEFSFLLQQILSVLKITTRALSATLFWVNHEKKQIILEASVSDSQKFTASRRFFFGNDLVSKIAMSGNAEIFSSIAQQAVKDLLCYYSQNESVHSFVGVPVFFPEVLTSSENVPLPVAVLAIDSEKEESYGEKTLRVLAHYSKIIAVLLKSYTEKYDLYFAAKIVKALEEFQKLSRFECTTQAIADKLVAAVSGIIDADDVTVVLYDTQTEKWCVASQLRTTQQLSVGQIIDFPKSIVGESLRTHSEIFIKNIATEKNCIRYFSGENLLKDGSLLCIPLRVHKKCLGAIVLEKETSSGFTAHDSTVLTSVISYAGLLLDVFSSKQFISEFVAVDSATNVLTEQYFRNEFENELERAHHFGGTLALAVIGIDDENVLLERFGENGILSIRRILAEQIQSSVRPFDRAGKLEQNFIALLVNTNATEVQLWGEKLRKTIAGNVMNDSGKPFTVTASIGICSPLKISNAQTMIQTARNAMMKAMENGGNSVKIF
jgi:diguanylate cyclase (GGDEF)-like protein